MPRTGSDRNNLRLRALRCACEAALGASLALTGMGCASLPVLPARPVEALRAGPLGLADDRPPDGALRPGDEVLVESGSEEARRQVRARVDARGALHVDSERDVNVAGLPLARAEQRVIEELRKTDKLADITLLFANRPSQNVTALGALARPGTVVTTPGMRVSDLIAAAGGILIVQEAAGQPAIEVADIDHAALVRNGTALPINMREALQSKPGHNVYVYPGDLLYVPFATENTVSVLGMVGSPRVLAHHSSMRLTEALSAAGGITTGGDKDDIRVVRGPVATPRAYQASLAAIADGEQHDSLLLPGDIVFVQDDFIEDVGEVFALVTPLASLGLLVAGIFVLTQQ